MSVVLMLCLMAAVPARTLVCDPGTEYQTIEHFGASDCWSMQKIGVWAEENKNRVADLLFSTTSGIGLSCWRFNLGGGVELDRIKHPWRTVETFETGEGQYDWTRQAGERWFLRAAKARGVPYFLAFVNSPPARMTRSGFTNGSPSAGPTNLKEGYEPAFARYLADVLEHFRENPDGSERIAFDYVSPVNEPHLPWNEGETQEGNRADNQTIKAIVNAVYEELERRHLSTEIRVPESNSYFAMCNRDAIMSGLYKADYGRYIDDFCGDASINGKIGKTLCAHGYSSCLLNGIFVESRQRLRVKLDGYPGWKFWQSEYCAMQGPHGEGGGGRDLTMTTALWVARAIHGDLTLCNASAWHWWTAVSPEDYKDGLIYTGYRQPGDPETVIPSKILWSLGQFSRFVRPGMVRVRLDGADDLEGIMASAYVDKSRGGLVVVIVNAGDTPVPVMIASPFSAPCTPYVTSDQPGDDIKAYPAITSGDTYSVPARSVVTLCTGK